MQADEIATATPTPVDMNNVHRAQAVHLHNRISGLPPTASTLKAMIALLKQGRPLQAALLATKSSAFYNFKLQTMFAAWSNVEGNPNVDLNDMTATLIGLVRDDIPFNQALFGDHLYTAKDDLVTVSEYLTDYGQPLTSHLCRYYDDQGDIIPPYYATSNEHYQCLHRQRHDLKSSLQHNKQSEIKRGHWYEHTNTIYTGPGNSVRYTFAVHHEGALPSDAVAGVLSTRAFARAYYSAGTNRRATAFVLKHFLCSDMESLHDSTIRDDYVRQDVSRSPGGDHQLYKSRCLGCHAGLDALSGWSVFYDFNFDEIKIKANGYVSYLGEQLLYSRGTVPAKITRNIIYDKGYDYRQDNNISDRFVNPWTQGQNSALGWNGVSSGAGASEFGKMIASSHAFSSCMAKQVYEQVCFTSEYNQKVIDVLARGFAQDGNYNMRHLFAATAVSCLLEDEEE